MFSSIKCNVVLAITLALATSVVIGCRCLKVSYITRAAMEVGARWIIRQAQILRQAQDERKIKGGKIEPARVL
ncbi:MAG: hypothetical protein WCD72_08440 [Dehalococcoidia bacterium]